MAISGRELLPIRHESDIVLVRKAVRDRAKELGLSLVNQTKLITAASEIARNTLIHGGGGECKLEVAKEEGRRGLRLAFEDRGPGIDDVDRALRDTYSSTGGLGLGLGGARRLVQDFEIETNPGEGTRVIVTWWI